MKFAVIALFAAAPLVSARFMAKSCVAEDLQHRIAVQNKLAGQCEDMCKEIGAYPKCTCPDFVQPDATPGVMTWPELLEHMDNLSEWGHGELKAWSKRASSFVGIKAQGTQSEKACVTQDLKNRIAVQNKLASDCEHMYNLSEWGHGELKAWASRAR